MDNLRKLKPLRDQLDQINSQLVELLVERFKILDMVVDVKSEGGLEPLDSHRVEEMKKATAGRLPNKYSEELSKILEEVFSQGGQYVSKQMEKKS